MNAKPPAAVWGLQPELFSLGRWPVSSYAFFMLLAVVVGVLLFWREIRRRPATGAHTGYVLLGALIGGILGSKLLMAALYWREVAQSFPDLRMLLSGRSIVGGLIGGAAGVFYVKRRLGSTARTGNLFVPGLAAGMAIGRMGCCLRGCCYGKPTALPWGLDFGDGVLRHPTQLYEALFMVVVLALGLAAVRRLPDPPGMVFQLLMLAYFAFRFLIEFVRDEPAGWLGFTPFQWIAAGVMVFYGIGLLRLLGQERRIIG